MHTAGGGVLERRAQFVPGTLDDPLSDAQVAEKFRDCAGFGVRPLGADDADALAAALGRLEERADLGGVFDDVHA